MPRPLWAERFDAGRITKKSRVPPGAQGAASRNSKLFINNLMQGCFVDPHDCNTKALIITPPQVAKVSFHVVYCRHRRGANGRSAPVAVRKATGSIADAHQK